MKAWLLDRIGDGVEKLRLADVADPQPTRGEIVLRLVAASLNPADRYLTEGQYPARPTFPHILGRDGIGVVIAVGPDVDPSHIGQRRVVLPSEVGVDRPGTFAEKIALPIDYTAVSPANWTDEQAAAAPLVYLTAWQALNWWENDAATKLVLVSGASGGVGIACVQIAKSLGGTVIALSRGDAKTAKLRSIGVDLVLDSNDADWPKRLLAATHRRRVDLAVDNIGGALLNALVSVMNADGCISIVGALAGPVPEFKTAALLFRRIRLGGVSVTGNPMTERQQVWRELLKTLPSDVRPLIDSVHPFDQLPTAFTALQRGPMGKVLVQIAP